MWQNKTKIYRTVFKELQGLSRFSTSAIFFLSGQKSQRKTDFQLNEQNFVPPIDQRKIGAVKYLEKRSKLFPLLLKWHLVVSLSSKISAKAENRYKITDWKVVANWTEQKIVKNVNLMKRALFLFYFILFHFYPAEWTDWAMFCRLGYFWKPWAIVQFKKEPITWAQIQSLFEMVKIFIIFIL